MTAPSAKPLFRAISGAARREREADEAQSHLLQLPEHVKERSGRRADDWYPTGQPEAIRALLSADGDRIAKLGKVWEPAVGDGDLAREIISAGIPVIGSDLVERAWFPTCLEDFLQTDHCPAPAIITNPPFHLINSKNGGAWLRHTLALDGWRYCALLLSWNWPGSRKNGLGALLDLHPFSWVYLMRWRLDFTGEGAPPMLTAWFVWDRDDPRSRPGLGPHPEPSFRWLDKTDHRQGTLL